MTPLTVTVAEAATLTGLSQDSIRNAVHKQEIPAKKVGKRIIIRHADLDEWISGLEDAS